MAGAERRKSERVLFRAGASGRWPGRLVVRLTPARGQGCESTRPIVSSLMR
jgi:hypothetical protein